MNKILKGAAFAAFGLAISLSAHADGHKDAVSKALNHNKHRMENDAVRDAARHPAEVFKFLGITETSTVAEVNPGGMWYSRILGPLLKNKGQYVGIEHHPVSYASSANYAGRLAGYRAKMAGMKDVFGDRAVAAHLMQLDSPVKDGSLDVVMVVRAMHNWQRRNFMDAGLMHLHAKLKDGGILGVIQHREPESSTAETKDSVNRGRWKQSALIAVIEKQGFKLVEASEINANPKDTKATSVWMLPPGLRGPKETKEIMKAIGESDRMTLKFKKISQ